MNRWNFQVHSRAESGGAQPHFKTLARWLPGPEDTPALECAAAAALWISSRQTFCGPRHPVLCTIQGTQRLSPFISQCVIQRSSAEPMRLLAASHLFSTALICAASLASPGDPLAPAQEAGTFHFADPNLTAELVTAEPDVVSPVCVAWDADGRMYVVEMTDYPTGPTGGRIRLLEDGNGDGRYERVTVFADELPFPTSVLPWRSGALVAAAPDIWFFKDNDGNGQADERHVLFTGFGQGNQQLRVNGLTWGIDNRVYGANGRSDGEVHAVEVQIGPDWTMIDS